MKKFILSFILSLLAITSSYAQTDSVKWALTADTGYVTVGNVTGRLEAYSNLVTRSYIADTCQKAAPTQLGEWTTAETTENSMRFSQFAASPVPGYNFTVTAITFNIGWAGTTNHVHANVYYSTDSTFATKSTLISNLILQNKNGVSAGSTSLNVPVHDGQTIFVRFYPWEDAIASGKNLGVGRLVIAGTAVPAGSSSIVVAPTTLSYGTINKTWTKDLSFTLSGTLLNPASDSIRIIPPADFFVSTTKGSGYSSYLALPYSGSTYNLDTIFVRFAPSTTKVYNDSVRISGGGTTTQSIYVSGTAVDAILGIFVSTIGSDSSAGTYAAPYLTIQKAVVAAQPGDTIFVRAGKYVNNTTISISKNGTANNLIALYAYPPDSVRPLLDFSSMVYGSSNRGISLSGSYWHIKGLDIYRAGDNGMNTSGSYNIVEFCAFHENRDGGCQIGGGGGYNQFINCDSYFNFDDSTTTNGVVTPGGNADGFSPKLDMGNGNYFYGCRSWQNSDDGWDGYQQTVNNDTTYLVNCWTWKNGYLKDGTHPYSGMNGNGFKMGGNSMVHNFIVNNCLSFDNYSKGFDQNNGTGSLTILNCTAFKNIGRDYSVPGTMAAGKQLILENSISYTGNTTFNSSITKTIATCSWSTGFTTPSSSDFLSIDTTGVSGPRKADGSLPDITFMHLATTSQFVNKGTNVGLAYIGTAPDLGCFETSVLTGVESLPSGRIAEYQLMQNYPNPFNPSTIISYQLTKRSYVTIQVYDALGREIATLEKNWHDAGSYRVTFTANNLASGIYFCRMNAEAQQKIIKLLLVK
jgi:hypothetical protein